MDQRESTATRRRVHTLYRKNWMRETREEAVDAGYCGYCFKRAATDGLASCPECREKRAQAYTRRPPEQVARDTARRCKASLERFRSLMANRHTEEGRAAYLEYRRKENAARLLLAEARARAQANGTRVSEELKRMGASPKKVARWRRQEERGNAQ